MGRRAIHADGLKADRRARGDSLVVAGSTLSVAGVLVEASLRAADALAWNEEGDRVAAKYKG